MDNLNKMCATCAELGKSCAGTPCQTWTGCIYYRQAGANAAQKVCN